MKEKVKRLVPTRETLRRLFLHSGNLCAFPGCGSLMMDAQGVFIGQLCHIEAAEEGGERFNEGMTNEERRHFDNLMLMCYPHHQVTNDIDAYSVQKLKQMKTEHGRRFSDPERAMLEHLTDWTEQSSATAPKNLRRFNRVLNLGLEDDELSQSLDELVRYLDRLANVPLELRRFLGAVTKRAWKMKGENIVRESMHGTAILASDVERALRLSRRAVEEKVSSLDGYGLMTVDSIDTGLRPEPALSIPNLRSGWPLWSNLAQFCEKESVSLEVFSESLDFAQLDE